MSKWQEQSLQKRVGLEVVLPHIAAPILMDQGCGFKTLWHVHASSEDKKFNSISFFTVLKKLKPQKAKVSIVNPD